MDCLDIDRTLAFVAGTMPPRERALIERHMATCVGCRLLVSEVARDPSQVGATVSGYAAGAAAPADVPAPRPGDRVGRFVVRGVLGVGAMGVVYDAYDEQLERGIALKRLQPRAGAGDADRLLAEARALARLAHPNVVAVYEVVAQAGALHLAMERVEGRSLRAWLAAGHRTQAEILAVLLGAARGLAAAHRAGIVHRDVKPDNLLVGQDGRARVTDFGLAVSLPAALEQPSADGAAETPADPAGTPRYMAPEQARGGAADARSDQYSLAVSVWEALAGVHPRAGRAQPGRAAQLAHAERVPRGLRKVLSRALAADPVARFPTVDAFAAALERAAGAGRRWIVAGAVASFVIAGFVVAAVAAYRDATARALVQAAEDARARTAAEAARQRERLKAEAAETTALRKQIAALQERVSNAAAVDLEVNHLRRTLVEKEARLRALARAVEEAEAREEASQPPDPTIVKRHVQRVWLKLSSCLNQGAPDAGDRRREGPVSAHMLIASTGTVLRVDPIGLIDGRARECVQRTLATVRVPPFTGPVVQPYLISLRPSFSVN